MRLYPTTAAGTSSFRPGHAWPGGHRSSLENEQLTTAEIVVELVIEAAGDHAPAVGRPRRVAAHPVRIVQEDLEDDASPRMRGGTAARLP